MSASIQQVKAAIDAAAKGTGFSCKTVSWEDAQRGHTFGGGLSSVGPNISDVRLYEKTGKLLYTVRSDNWNERLGYVAARDVAMVTGNERSVASALEPTTLQDFLQSIGQRAGYVGCTTPSLFEPTLDGIFGIRFQTVFLPVENASFGSATPPKTEFCTEVYNYQTRSDDDPRNMLLLATPQGTSVQQDGAGNARQYFHSVDSNGTVHRYWLEAEKSEKAVGGAQNETVAEQQAAAARGKAVAVRLGPSSMGTRFNVQMLIQIPLKQKPRPAPRRCGGNAWAESADCFGAAPSMPMTNACFGTSQLQCAPAPAAAPALSKPFAFSSSKLDGADRCRRPAPRSGSRAGASNAARVSRGTEQDVYSGVANKMPERDPSQHGTITVTMYYTVVGGVPSVADVKAAIQDLDQLYKQCPSDKKLVHCHEVTSRAGTGLFQPPPPPPPAPTFPSPFDQPKTLPTPVAPVAPATAGMVCPVGHGMTPNTQMTAPPQGWFCDGCGCFVEPPKVNGALVQGFACRACDFDVCLRCAKLPKCPTGRPLTTLPKTAVPMTLEQQVLTRCNLCMKQFARHVASMRGCQSPACNHPPFSACEPCLAASATP